ncbi:Gfo/Idh/MocA family protein [Nocardiopsis salina]|uniref:Gfo/Idh/MocA family protein n=1 Tax=Nocardiopsis salina TaxID=245836 RepID=UPI00035DDB63|nr:Gfo/Idh/MocA family oxidoreductase [Nocardiopsis salina]
MGVHGYGRVYLRSLLTLAHSGAIDLAGLCDPRPPGPDDDLEGHGFLPCFSDLDEALRHTGARITVVATPIHTHLPLALTALRHGSHLMLEKPATPSLEQFDRLTEALSGSGLVCQVGFQSLGSAAIGRARRLVAEGAVGELRGIGTAGTWKRTSAYYERAPWAGRRRMDGADVVDGALTNPFAHAVATSLALAGEGHRAPQRTEVELYRAHPIEGDDTSSLRLHTRSGTPVTVAVTLCASGDPAPELAVHGDAGRIELSYTEDRLTLRREGQDPHTEALPRADLMGNLVAHLRDEAPLLCPLEATRGFAHVVEAVRTAPPPRPIGTEYQEVWRESGHTHRTVHGITGLIRRSAESLALFSELGAPWARSNASAI